jgi:hypothetical protein
MQTWEPSRRHYSRGTNRDRASSPLADSPTAQALRRFALLETVPHLWLLPDPPSREPGGRTPLTDAVLRVGALASSVSGSLGQGPGSGLQLSLFTSGSHGHAGHAKCRALRARHWCGAGCALLRDWPAVPCTFAARPPGRRAGGQRTRAGGSRECWGMNVYAARVQPRGVVHARES